MKQRSDSLDSLAVSLLVVCCFLWGLNQVAVKLALPEVPALVQAGVRSLIAAALLLVWSRWRGIKLFDRDGSLPGGLLAGLLFAAEFGCIFIGLQYTSASRMVVFIYLSPFVVALGMPFIASSERLSALQMGGLLAAFGGVAWAFAGGFTDPVAGPNQLFGDALGVIAALLWGATTLAIRGSRLSVASAEKTLFYQLGISGIALSAAALVTGENWSSSLSPLAWSSILFQGVIISFISYLTWFWLIRHYPATRLASFSLLTPVFGLLLGALLLGEPITTRLLIALTTVAIGIYVVNRKPRVSV